jgi:hypothetical protein
VEPAPQCQSPKCGLPRKSPSSAAVRMAAGPRGRTAHRGRVRRRRQ